MFLSNVLLRIAITVGNQSQKFMIHHIRVLVNLLATVDDIFSEYIQFYRLA